jgi:hypothetical protein
MDIEKIVVEWSKDCRIDDTELTQESSKIPNIHNKYLCWYMGERVLLQKMKSEHKKIKRLLTEYYLGELTKEELSELNRTQFFKKILKNELDTYIDSDDLFIESLLKVVAQEEKVSYLESILKSITTRNFLIKNMIDWHKLTMGA